MYIVLYLPIMFRASQMSFSDFSVPQMKCAKRNVTHCLFQEGAMPGNKKALLCYNCLHLFYFWEAESLPMEM